jgi:hypothetical protein
MCFCERGSISNRIPSPGVVEAEVVGLDGVMSIPAAASLLAADCAKERVFLSSRDREARGADLEQTTGNLKAVERA